MKNFIKSLERSDNKTLIEAILEGYSVIFENNSVEGHKPEWWNEPSDNAFAKGMTKGDVIIDWLKRNKVKKEGGKYIFYHATPIKGGAKDMIRKGSYLATDKETAIHQASRDRGSKSSEIRTIEVRLNPEELDHVGVWSTLRNDYYVDGGMDQSARGINESAELYASGMCDVFALALNKLYGYEPYVVRGYYKDGDEYAYENSHAVVKSSKGFLDYKGLISEQELKKAAHFTNNVEFVKIEPVSVEELKECFTSEPIPEIEIEKAVDYIKNNNSLFEATGKSELQKLKDNKVPLTDEERKEVFKKDAVWHSGSSIDPNTGEKVQKVSAVWKSKNPKTGDITYISNTHRLYNTAKSLGAIINKYHNIVKDSA